MSGEDALGIAHVRAAVRSEQPVSLLARGWCVDGRRTGGEPVSGHGSGGVVEEEAESIALASADNRDAVADRRGRPAPGAADRPITGGEHQALAVGDGDCGGPGLGSRVLLDKDELTTGVIDVGSREVDDHLQGEHHLAVQVAVEGVPVPRPVSQQERRRLSLPGTMAARQPLVQALGPGRGPPELGVPIASDGQKARI